MCYNLKMKKIIILISFIFNVLCQADIIYEFSGISTIEGTKKESPVEGIVYLKAPFYFKVEFKNYENPFFGEENVILSNNQEKIFLLNTRDKTYAELDLNDLIQFFKIIPSDLLNIEIENTKVEIKEGSENLNILNYPCKHIIVETSYEMKIKMLFIKNTNKIYSYSEYWISNSFPINMKDWYQEKSLKTGVEEIDLILEKETSIPKGMVLKYKRRIEIKNEKGEITKINEEAEVTKIEEKTLPLDFFEVPKDYKKIEFFPFKERREN